MTIEETFYSKINENGDISFTRVGDNPLLNVLFFSEYLQKHLDEVPFIGISEKSQLFAQFMRDPRFGLGRRDLGRVLMCKTGCTIEQIIKAGRVDDLFTCIDQYETVTWEAICDYLYNEIASGNELVKKWMPRYSSKSKKLAEKFATQWFSKVKGGETYVGRKCIYGKFVKANTTEQHLSRKEAYKIQFEHVPSLASIKYAHRFATGEDTKERYSQYLEDVKAGKKELHVSVTTCYDIYKNRGKIDPDVFFEKLPKISGSWLPIVDTSGSMLDDNDSFGKALSIGHYLAKTSTYLPNKAIAFSSHPQLITLGEPLPRTRPMWSFNTPEEEGSQYIREIRSLYTGDCSNTNFGAVMNLLSKCDEFPEYLVVLTDMEFDYGSGQSTRELEKLWKEKGYTTKIVWWNLNSRNKTAPEMDKMGNIFLSGYNPMLLKYLEAGFNGEQFLDKLLVEYKKNIEK